MIDVEGLKEDIGIEEVLRYAGADPPSTGMYDRWTSIHCPFHDDHVASGAMHRGRGLFACFVCTEGPLDIIAVAGMITGQADFKDRVEWLTGTFR